MTSPNIIDWVANGNRINSECEVAEYISEALSQMPNQAHANLFREIIFTSMVGNWDLAREILWKHCPETKGESSDD